MGKYIEILKKGFSIFSSETKKITETVVGKTSNLVDIAKLNIALADTEKKINDNYRKIGETVYKNYAEGSAVSDEFTDLCTSISEFVKETESLKAQVAELKNAITCPECGYVNEKESEFCSKCGSRLSAEKASKDDDKVIEVTDVEDDE